GRRRDGPGSSPATRRATAHEGASPQLPRAALGPAWDVGQGRRGRHRGPHVRRGPGRPRGVPEQSIRPAIVTTSTVADDAACIIGIGETDYCRAPGSGTSDLGVVLRAAMAAIEDSGFPRRDVDGVLTPYINASAEEII